MGNNKKSEALSAKMHVLQRSNQNPVEIINHNWVDSELCTNTVEIRPIHLDDLI